MLSPSGSGGTLWGNVRVILRFPIPLHEWEEQTRCLLHVVHPTLSNVARDTVP